MNRAYRRAELSGQAGASTRVGGHQRRGRSAIQTSQPKPGVQGTGGASTAQGSLSVTGCRKRGLVRWPGQDLYWVI